MNCYEFKGGSGTSSRLVEHDGTSYTVGVFVQTNFGARHELVIAGVPLGAELADDNPLEEYFSPAGAGSCIAVVATDAPLLPGQCKALARRVTLGLARTGTTGSHFSGDIFIALSTAQRRFDSPRDPRRCTGAVVPTMRSDPFRGDTSTRSMKRSCKPPRKRSWIPWSPTAR